MDTIKRKEIKNKMYKILKEMRIKKDISALEMAKLIGLKTASAYYKKENGTINFSISEANIIADFFNMTVDEIF